MNTKEILRTVNHREYPIATGPWVMSQVWLELLFAHWPVKPDVLRSLIPPVFEIDTFEREAWVGVVPFRMRDIHPRGLPSVQGISHFPELNVRTYVTVDGKPGVYFFSLDAGNALAVAIARSVFHLPYFNAHMTTQFFTRAIALIATHSPQTTLLTITQLPPSSTLHKRRLHTG